MMRQPSVPGARGSAASSSSANSAAGSVERSAQRRGSRNAAPSPPVPRTPVAAAATEELPPSASEYAFPALAGLGHTQRFLLSQLSPALRPSIVSATAAAAASPSRPAGVFAARGAATNVSASFTSAGSEYDAGAAAASARLSSAVAQDVLERYPTEESARAQLLYAQLQVEALTEMNARMQMEKRASAAAISLDASSVSALAASREPAHLGGSGSVADLASIARNIDQLVAILSAVRAPKDAAVGADGTHASRASPPSLAQLAERLESVVLPLARLAADSARDADAELAEARTAGEDTALRASISAAAARETEQRLRAELAASQRAERAAVARCDDLARQAHYLKSFQLALANASAAAPGEAAAEHSERDVAAAQRAFAMLLQPPTSLASHAVDL
jgi:hypothetical protein